MMRTQPIMQRLRGVRQLPQAAAPYAPSFAAAPFRAVARCGAASHPHATPLGTRCYAAAKEGDLQGMPAGGDGGYWDDAEDFEEPKRGVHHKLPVEVRCFDTAMICVQSGKGGDGMTSFRREKFVPRGGPDGGNGGHGGHVWLVADKSLNSLSHFRKKVHFRAKKGQNGMGRNKNGAVGVDAEVRVPVGTIVKGGGVSLRESGQEEAFGAVDGTSDDWSAASWAAGGAEDPQPGEDAELLGHGDRLLLAHGGRGGRGNASFRSSQNKVPRLSESGEDGTERWVQLELKLVADVGIVGAPNAGKSTLLSSLSNAKPKIAAYPFTTLVPNLGVCDHLHYRSIVFADVPGLLEGAHTGVGLGLEFLRHCERCKVMVQVVDATSPDPLGDYHAIRTELDIFSGVLSDKPFIVAINKLDVAEAEENAGPLRAHLEAEGVPFCAISALARQGIDGVVDGVDGMLSRVEAHGAAGGPIVAYEGFAPTDEDAQRAIKKELKKRADAASSKRDLSDFSVDFDGFTRTWTVTGRGLESFVQMTDWQYYQAWKRFQRIIKVSGLYHALKRSGVRDGDTIVVGTREFQWNSRLDSDLSYSDFMNEIEQNNNE